MNYHMQKLLILRLYKKMIGLSLPSFETFVFSPICGSTINHGLNLVTKQWHRNVSKNF